ncbi:MAG: 7-cyano-7-deazaguanine synthase QueC [Victivallales bacterium]|nr:7-cyano-7-deazaguanine synthase QueC [Victivallales bacterium]
MKKAVILLSGGLDSATALAIAKRDGFECHAMSFKYGQRHDIELRSAANVAQSIGAAEHITVEIDLAKWGGSALTSDSIDVPKKQNGMVESIPVTYVPARNTIFLSFAVGWAETLDAKDIFIGVNSVDYSGYPDCRPHFIASFAETARLGTRAADEGWRFEIHAPLQTLNKAEIITLGHSLGVDYSLTHSCYDPAPDGAACGECDSCALRADGFAKAGIPDPTVYADVG